MLLGYRASPDFTDALIHLTTQEASIEGTLIQKIHPNKEIKGKKIKTTKDSHENVFAAAMECSGIWGKGKNFKL